MAVFDCMIGKVLANNRKGCYVSDGCNTAFLPRYNFRIGTRIIATVKYVNDNNFAFLILDSVLYDDAA